MTAAKLPIKEVRQRLSPAPKETQSTGASRSAYREKTEFVPPSCDRRDATAPEALLRCMQEKMRLRKLIPDPMDAKAAPPMLLAMLLVEHGAAAVEQCIVALGAAASWDEMRDVPDMALLLHGRSAANRGDGLLTAFVECEREDRIAGIVAAYD
jgi:hypothetical protein